ncbi:MAG: methyltransferase [Actinomycetales bacterium]|nr:methyltransferase [Actinomycetales bacterium]
MRPDPSLVARLRDDLRAARYEVDALRELWGEAADAALARGDRVPARRALDARPGPRSTLARCLLLGLPVTADELAAALPALGLDGALALGLVAHRDGQLVPLLDLRPTAVLDERGAAAWWVASDLGELATGRPLRDDHVLGLGGASATLAGLLLPGPIGAALDLGTGSGIQALHLAREGARVVATDLSERALDLAALTLGLAGVDAELHAGDLFAPVAGRRFARVVSNPPFVITPRRGDVPVYEYRDGGAVGDALVARVVAGCAEHLAPGGVAQLLGNWEYRADSDGLERAAGWARDAGLEYWIVERERLDPARYAETWIRDGGTPIASPEGERLLDAWLDDFAERGVAAIGFGYLLLRRPAGLARLARAERIDAPLGDAPALGAHWAQLLDAHDRLAELDDAELLRRHLVVAGDVTEERSHLPGEEHPRVIVLRQGGGFRREVRASTELAAVVGACDGELPVGAIVRAVAGILGIHADVLTEALLPELRELIATGLLTLPEG